MEKDYIEVSIGGVTYIINSDDLSSIAFIDGQLVNTSQNSITLKNSYSDDTTYPYIRCGGQQVCRLYERYNGSYSIVKNDVVYNGDFLKVANYPFLIFCLLFLILGVKLVWKR